MKIKTRFAPSPTGYLHIGSVRTALYSWLFTKHYGGKFILRIEDTDLERSTKDAIYKIIDEMNWLNLNWDDGPYLQTERLSNYNLVINKMLSQGTAYKCYCSKERLKILREFQLSNGEKPRYDGYCRSKHEKKYNNIAYVVRFLNPQQGLVVFNDLIRGPIKFNNQELDDLIICRTNGIPTYNFCVVIDDIDMKITHVIRGEDHINNTPRQINIFKALGAPIPEYAHVPMILGNDKKKLSKRNGVLGITQYREDGFLPEALLNYLLLLGWSYGNQEIFSIEQMKQLFSINNINKSASIFDIKKLLWLNHYYINKLPSDYIASHLKWHMQKQEIDISIGPLLVDLVKLFSSRCNTLKEMAKKCYFFYQDLNYFNTEAAKKYLLPLAINPLQEFHKRLSKLIIWTPESIKNTIMQTTYVLGLETNKLGMPLRVAITGVTQSPALSNIIYIIGKSRSLARIDVALSYILTNNY